MARVGHRGVDAEYRAQLGLSSLGAEEARGEGARLKPRRGFLLYWRPLPMDVWGDSPFIERMAVRQVSKLLAPVHLQALETLGREGTQRLAAEKLGMDPSALNVLLKRARLAFTHAWFAPDTAPPLRRASKGRLGPQRKTCPNGHPLEGENLGVRWQGGYRCKKCDREGTRKRKAALRAAEAQSGRSSTS